MKHLYVVVEGETELAFVNRLLIPYYIVPNFLFPFILYKIDFFPIILRLDWGLGKTP
jgi:hypothetical protein